ncbi:MAG: PIN domain-containing protein [Chloroflexota bacterium]|nr:PIN domain-containing protein [Chloroflexota bacterium]
MMRFLFDTSVLVDYIRGDEMAANAIIAASQKGKVYISCISIMELWSSPMRKRRQIQAQIKKIKLLSEIYGLEEITCSERIQHRAQKLLECVYAVLGKHAVPDALIMSAGITRYACLVTTERAWREAARQAMRCGVGRSTIQVMSPVEVVEKYA